MAERITQERLKELVTYDPLTGVFTANINLRAIKAGERLGSVDWKGYRRIKLDRHTYKEHRLAFLYMTGKWPVYQVDHINQDKTDNKWENLRDVPMYLNMQNRGVTKANKSGQKGVWWRARDNKWQVRCRYNGIYYSLGYYPELQEASQIASLFYKLTEEQKSPPFRSRGEYEEFKRTYLLEHV